MALRFNVNAVPALSVNNTNCKEVIQRRSCTTMSKFKTWRKTSKLIRFAGQLRSKSIEDASKSDRSFDGHFDFRRRFATSLQRSSSKPDLTRDEPWRKSFDIKKEKKKHDQFLTPKCPRASSLVYETPSGNENSVVAKNFLINEERKSKRRLKFCVKAPKTTRPSIPIRTRSDRALKTPYKECEL